MRFCGFPYEAGDTLRTPAAKSEERGQSAPEAIRQQLQARPATLFNSSEFIIEHRNDRGAVT